MGRKWRKVKLALGLNNLCINLPRALDDDDDYCSFPSSERLSGAALLSPSNWDTMGSSSSVSPLSSSHGLRLSKSSSKSSKRTCSICLTKMKQGGGHAIFTAECSHSFHFHCIASNVKRGNEICPVCRSIWNKIPIQSPGLDPPQGSAAIDPRGRSQNDALMDVFQAPEPSVFGDDESSIKIKTYPELSTAPRSCSYDNFNVLVHLKAAAKFALRNPSPSIDHASLSQSQNPRAPVDLVTVLDISGSMFGTKLALLKQALGFVIQNLDCNDRLSVIAFSSNARCLFPLRRMSEVERMRALLAVNSLHANGGTNIAEGLRKGVEVMEYRTEKNPVSSIILLSDGKDTYTVNGKSANTFGFGRTPVHTFGFGEDHDASLMHSISEISEGTFSFIETETMIQDAFALCIGGLLNVVVQELQMCIECMNPNLCLGSVKAGSYLSRVSADEKTRFVDIGDLYANEERDFLVSVKVPAESSASETSLLMVKCVYKDPLTKEMKTLKSDIVRIQRPEIVGHEAALSIEVDRQLNRFRAAEAMSEARNMAEQGDLEGAVSILENCRRVLSETVSAKSRDRLWIALDAELKEMEERMVSRRVYEVSGRAYILSGLSSHSWQRATVRGDSTDSLSLVQAYQTPSMFEMLTQSQSMFSQPKPR